MAFHSSHLPFLLLSPNHSLTHLLTHSVKLILPISVSLYSRLLSPICCVISSLCLSPRLISTILSDLLVIKFWPRWWYSCNEKTMGMNKWVTWTQFTRFYMCRNVCNRAKRGDVCCMKRRFYTSLSLYESNLLRKRILIICSLIFLLR